MEFTFNSLFQIPIMLDDTLLVKISFQFFVSDSPNNLKTIETLEKITFNSLFQILHTVMLVLCASFTMSQFGVCWGFSAP